MSIVNKDACSVGVQLVLYHTSGQWMRTEVLYMPYDSGRNAAQAIGSASTYARRYLVSSFWNICSEPDDDANSSHGPKTNTTSNLKPTIQPKNNDDLRTQSQLERKDKAKKMISEQCVRISLPMTSLRGFIKTEFDKKSLEDLDLEQLHTVYKALTEGDV